MEPGARPPARHGVSRASLLASLALVVVLGAGSLALDRSRAASSTTPGEYRIVMSDYRFSPDRLTLRPGERVTLIIVNESQSVPGVDHEFMLGRVPVTEETVFGPAPGDGFEQPLLTGGIELQVLQASKVSMLMTGGVRLAGPNLDQLLAPVSGAMPGMPGMPAATPEATPTPGMPMGGTPTPTMPGMGGMPTATPEATPMPTMPGMPGMPAATPTATPMPGGGAAQPGMPEMFRSRDLPDQPVAMPTMQVSQLMAVLNSQGVLTISFVVPDLPGVWEYGCFAQNGQHYLNGMRGTIEIVRG